MRDLVDALRALRSRPLISGLAISSLALGIGSVIAIFSLMDRILLRALPVREPDRLALVTSGGDETRSLWVSTPLWEAFRELQLFDASFAWVDERLDLAGRGETEWIDGIWVSEEFFDILGVAPLLGRTFREGEQDEAVCVLSYEFWNGKFGRTSDVVGRSITVERVPFTIVGVMPRGFFGPEVGSRFDVAIPLASEPLVRGKESRRKNPYWPWLRIMVRLEPGQGLDSGTAVLRQAQPELREATLPSYRRPQDRDAYLKEPLTLVSAAKGVSFLRSRYREPLFVLIGIAGLLLLIACGNVASLLFARALARRRELAVRSALGASRLALVRQLLAESLVMSTLAALPGLVLGYCASRLVVWQLSTPIYTVSLDLLPDSRGLALSVGLAIVTTLLFGTAPAWRATGISLNASLVAQGSGRLGSRRVLGSGVPIVAQVALAIVLLVAAGLFVRTFSALANLDLGLHPEAVLDVEVETSGSEVDPPERALLYEELSEALRSLPNIASAAGSLAVPIGFTAMMTEVSGGERVHKNVITPDWFETLGTRLLEGRDFDSRDREGAPLVAIVNDEFRRRFLEGVHPIGRVVYEMPEGKPLEIVGLVEDAVYRSLREPAPPTIYVPAGQFEAERLPTLFHLVARPERGSPEALAKSVVTEISRVDRDLSLTPQVMVNQVRATFRQETVLATLSTAFGALALLLAALGVYGVTVHAASLRRREAALRIALGASRSSILAMMLGPVTGLVGLGIMSGATVSLWAAGLVEALLFGLPARDPAILGAAALVLAIVAALASWLSARRVTRLEPAQVLREL